MLSHFAVVAESLLCEQHRACLAFCAADVLLRTRGVWILPQLPHHHFRLTSPVYKVSTVYYYC